MLLVLPPEHRHSHQTCAVLGLAKRGRFKVARGTNRRVHIEVEVT